MPNYMIIAYGGIISDWEANEVSNNPSKPPMRPPWFSSLPLCRLL
jgi:hypothetical protein